MRPVRILAVVLLAGFASFPQVSHAQFNWYAGLDIGQSKADASIAEFQFNTAALQDDGSDTGFRLRVGYEFGRFFAAEIGYADFGDFVFDFDPGFCPGGAPQPCPFSARTSIDGFVTNGVGRLPIGEHWAIYARLGWFSLRVKTRVPGIVDDSENMDGLQTGLGVSYRAGDHWELLLDYTKFEQVDLGLTVGGGVGVFSFGDTELTSLGLNYRW